MEIKQLQKLYNVSCSNINIHCLIALFSDIIKGHLRNHYYLFGFSHKIIDN